jgi:hypothetical protein
MVNYLFSALRMLEGERKWNSGSKAVQKTKSVAATFRCW